MAKKKNKDPKVYKPSVTSIPLEEHLGEDKLDALASKEQEVKKLPKKTSTKRKMSPNSLKNLVQYNDTAQKKESKKKSLQNLIVNIDEDNTQKEETEEDDNSLLLFKTLHVKIGGESIFLYNLIDNVFPTYQTLNKKEQIIFNNIAATYLKDFENEELAYSDIDAVFSLAMNKILELRLLKLNKTKPTGVANLISSLEKITKQNEKLKESLSNTRKDRKKNVTKSGLSILDLAAAFDEQKKLEAEEREKELLKEESEFLKDKKPTGNAEDFDAR